MIFVLLALFIILLLLRLPIGISLALSTITVMLFQGDYSMSMVPQRLFSAMYSFPLLAIPGFVLSGVILAQGGISKYLIHTMRTWVGHLPGGLSVVTILTCMIFAAISGSSPATAAAVGSVMIPAMVNNGYDKKYVMGLIAAAGTLGILIPPSIPFILFGITAEESIGKLFMAGFIPGILLTVSLIVFAIIYARIKGYGVAEKYPMGERIKSLKKSIWGFLLPILILGSIYTGIATPTESSVLAVVYGFFVSIVIYKEMGLKELRNVFVETINITSMIFLIIAAASLFGLYITNEQIPQKIGELIANNDVQTWQFFIIVSLILLIMGTFLDAAAIILITLPIFFPIATLLGIHPYHFAVVMVVNLEIGMITPPVGLNLFVVSGVGKERIENVVRGIIPFILLLLFILIILIIFPSLSTWFPSIMN